MKKWKTIFVVSGVTLALSAICGVAHLRESSNRGGISPQLAKASLVGQGETQRNVSSAGTMHDYHASGVVDRNTNPQPDKAAFAQKTQKLQMPFIANNGQVDEQVEFYAKTFGGTVFVTKDGEIVYALPKTEKSEVRSQNVGWVEQADWVKWPFFRDCYTIYCSMQICKHYMRLQNAHLTQSEGETQQPANPQSKNPSDSSNPKSGIALREEFVGARVKVIQGEDPSVTKVNYFKGSDPEKWRTDVSTYNFVNLGEIYKGVELKLKAYGDNVEKLFCVKPKSNPDQIKVQLSGAMSIVVNEEGQLEVETELGPVKFTKPVAYQEIDGKRVEVECKYTISDCGVRIAECVNNLEFGFWDLDFFPIPHSAFRILKSTNSDSKNPRSKIQIPKLEYGFTVASYDHTKPLIIDPLLASTFLGGAGDDRGYSLALDTSGNIYVTGSTWSTDFPTTSGAYDTTFNGGYTDVFVSKLDSGLTSLLASTHLGGSSGDRGYSLALDTSGNVYVTGTTYSTDFPTTSGAYDTSLSDYDDVFVSKLDSGLTSLLASTYLGGSASDYGYSLALDTSGNVYVTGWTKSSDFPTTSGAYDDTSLDDSWGDAFVSKLDGGLTSLLASTYLGGNAPDGGNSLTLDTSGNVYVTGGTYSTDFPTTSGAYYDTSLDDSWGDAFVSKLDSGLTSLLASTYLGGNASDGGDSLTLDTSGNVYVTGETGSSDFPTTSGAYDTSYNGWGDAFVSKLNSGLTSLLASTYLGGAEDNNDEDEYGTSIALDTSGNVYVTGLTSSSDFPTTSGAYDTSFNGGDYDVFVSKLDGNLSWPSGCNGETTTVETDTGDFELLKWKRKVVTMTVTDAGGCPVANEKVSAKVNRAGKERISILFSSTSRTTDENGAEAFTIIAKKKTGNAKVIFKAGGIMKKITVTVVSE